MRRRKMVRKKIGLMGILILSILSLAETRTAYILVPGDLNPEEVKVSGVIKDGNVLFTEAGAVDTGEEVDVTVVESTTYPAYGDTKYIKMSVEGVEDTAEVKFMMGYESGTEGGIPRYTIISSSDIKDNTEVQDAFYGTETTEGINGLEMMDFNIITSYNNYDTFPGRELTGEDTVLSGFVVGDQVIDDENTEPSNIVDIYYKKDEESPYNVVDGGAGISPTASDQNSEFELWAIKVYGPGDDEGKPVLALDSNGNKIQRTDGAGNLLYALGSDGNEIKDDAGNSVPLWEPERVLIYTSKDTDEDIILGGDLRTINFDEGQVFPTDTLDTAITTFQSATEGDLNTGTRYDSDWEGFPHYKFDVRVRFKNANGEELDINGEPVDLGSGSGQDRYQWQFYELDGVELYFNGGQKFTFGMDGTHVIIIPGDGIEVPTPVEQKIYVMEDSGKLMEGDATITSKYEDTVKYRTSNVKMKVMTESGITEKNYEIENIKE